MLGTYGSIGSDQSRLDVAQRRVDPLEGGRFGGSRACAGLDRGVRASDVSDGRETRKTIGQDLAVGGERRIGTCASLCFITQAAVWVTPSRRPSSMLEPPFLDCDNGR